MAEVKDIVEEITAISGWDRIQVACPLKNAGWLDAFDQVADNDAAGLEVFSYVNAEEFYEPLCFGENLREHHYIVKRNHETIAITEEDHCTLNADGTRAYAAPDFSLRVTNSVDGTKTEYSVCPVTVDAAETCASSSESAWISFNGADADRVAFMNLSFEDAELCAGDMGNYYGIDDEDIRAYGEIVERAQALKGELYNLIAGIAEKGMFPGESVPSDAVPHGFE